MKTLKYKTNGEYKDLYSIYKPVDLYNGYDYVDMGEAGIWAKYPLGVTEWNENLPNNILYFAWGETEGYTKSQIGIDKQFTWDDYKFGNKENLTKYNEADGLTILEPEDDAAHIIMGGNWRMPTADESRNLIKLCNSEWIENYNNTGINGILLTLKTDNSKQIFFPYIDNNIYENDIYFWTSKNFNSPIDNSFGEALTININGKYKFIDYVTYLDFSLGNYICGFIPKSE